MPSRMPGVLCSSKLGLQQIDIQCTGIDEQLEALKTRYRNDPFVSHQLAQFETGIDPQPKPR